MRAEFEFDSPYWDEISDAGKHALSTICDLIKMSCLERHSDMNFFEAYDCLMQAFIISD